MTVYQRHDQVSPIVVTMPADLDETEFNDAAITFGNYTVTTTYDPATATATGVVSAPTDGHPGWAEVVRVAVAWKRPDGTFRTTFGESIVIEHEYEQLPIAEARDMWPNTLSDAALYQLLAVAAIEVNRFAPNTTEPILLRTAQLMQARNTANASRASAGTGDLGDGSYAITARPLDWAVKQLLRPQHGMPRVG